ncbi:hypothetical protein ASNO1_63360 [Corallococcus caeni]|uniref:PLD phosphodiesterase domain-containing protein n=1 Tax=Corallococcus caeni TaxID=3082388 RepID=A0ABQ6R1I6_9BACT|nr:hypothetical protein ASNO1_63360 [Corallococcus sp. NO1]
MRNATKGNRVRFLLDEEFFEELHRQLCRIELLDPDPLTYVLVAMWLCKPDTQLPAVTVQQGSRSTRVAGRTFINAITSLTQRGHPVKFVLWNGANPVEWPRKLISVPYNWLRWAGSLTGLIRYEPLDSGILRFGGGARVFSEALSFRARSTPNMQVYAESYSPNWLAQHGLTASNHQKFVVCSHAGRLEALLGGFNINESYSAKTDHGLVGERWHDTAVLIEGPAAHAVQTEWLRRWNKQYWYGGDTLPARLEDQGFIHHGSKKQTAQRLVNGWNTGVTIATTNGEPFTRENDIRDLVIERIKVATKYIYLENYALTDPALVAALSKRMAEKKDLKVIVLVTHPKNPYYSTPISWSPMEYYTFVQLSLPRFTHVRIVTTHEIALGATEDEEQVLDPATAKFVSAENGTFTWSEGGQTKSCSFDDIAELEAPTVMYGPISTDLAGSEVLPRNAANAKKPQWPYVHSKLALFDDQVAFVGSSNWTYRSMEYDGEITAMVTGEETVRGIRERLFEHWQQGLTVDNYATKAAKNEQDRVARRLRPVHSYMLPLSFGDFLHSAEVTLVGSPKAWLYSKATWRFW